MPGTPTVRYNVANLDQWGRLIKSWATRLDYVSQAEAAQPPRDYWVNTTWQGAGPPGPAPATIKDTDAAGNPQPWCLPPMASVQIRRPDGENVTLPNAVAMTVADFKTRVEAAGVDIESIPPQFTNVVIVQGQGETMVIRLPPKDMLQGSEDDLLNGVDYSFRPFYAQAFGCEAAEPDGQSAIMELHANRIGEYTLNNCM